MSTNLESMPLSLILRDMELMDADIRAGRTKEHSQKQFEHNKEVFEELYDIAKARVRNTKTKEPMIYRLEDLRYHH